MLIYADNKILSLSKEIMNKQIENIGMNKQIDIEKN